MQTVYFHFRNKATVLKEVVDALESRVATSQTSTGPPRARCMREETD